MRFRVAVLVFALLAAWGTAELLRQAFGWQGD